MNNKQIALAIVAILLVAGIAVAAIYLLGGDDKDDEVVLGEEGRLMIYGNANNDDYLNEDDVKYLKKIINGEAERTDFCDANQDGAVDDRDVEFLEKLLKREPMKIWYYNPDTNSADAVNYPVKKVVAILGESCIAMKILGQLDKVVGQMGVNDEVLFSDLGKDVVPIKGSGAISIETLSTTGADTLISIPGPKYITNEVEIESKGIQVLRFDYRSADAASAYLTSGFLLEAEERGQDYAHFNDKILTQIEDTVSKSKYNNDRVPAMCLGYAVAYGKQSNYGEIIEMAGGKDAVDWENHRNVSEGLEWLYNYDFDWIYGRMSNGGYNYTNTPENNQDLKDMMYLWEKSYSQTDAFKAGHVIILQSSIPDLVKTAYLAGAFYPDLFGEDFGDKVHQEYLNMFIDNLAAQNFDVTKCMFGYTIADLEKL